MRRLISLVFAALLSGCGGAGTSAVVPASVTPAGTLYVASWDRIDAYAAGGGAMQREITGLGAFTAGMGGCGFGCHFRNVNTLGTKPDGTLLVGTFDYQHPAYTLWGFALFGPSASGAAQPVSTYAIGRSMYGQIAGLPGSQQYAVLGYSGVELYSGNGDPASHFKPSSKYPVDLAVDASGNFYVASSGPNVIAVYAPSAPQDSSGKPTPLRTIALTSKPTHLAVGPDGAVYAAVVTAVDGKDGPPGVEVVQPGASASSHFLGPFVTTGTWTQIAGLAVDAQNELFVALNEVRHNRVAVFGPGASDPRAPIRAIAEPADQPPRPDFGNGIVAIAIAP